jgi:DNA polymerase III delta subunit
MIILLHGDNIVASRSELNRFREVSVGKEIINLDGKNLEESTLIQSLEGSGLFNDNVLVVIENLFGKIVKKTGLVKKYAQIIDKSVTSQTVLLWEDRELPKGVMTLLGSNVTNRLFAIPKTIFTFLDSIGAVKPDKLLLLYSETIKTSAPELLMFMFSKRIRQLIQVKDHAASPDILSWQIGRLTSQANYFTMEKLVMIYKKLTQIEYSIKSGTSPFDLTQNLELLLTEI